MEIVLATNNTHKLHEVQKICEGLDVTFVLPPEEFNPEETGSTFFENSYIKAKAANDLTHKMTLADDSGLCVNALDGAPGLYSSRFAGTQQEKIDRFHEIVNEMANLYAKKNSNYGDSFGKLYNDLGPIAGLVPLHNKLDRITALVKGEHNNFESLEDSIKDFFSGFHSQ